MANSPICSIPDCGKPHYARSWCNRHYYSWKRSGSPIPKRTEWGVPAQYLQETVLLHTGEECLIWPYGRTKWGYAQIRIGRKKKYVHRLVCEHFRGPPSSLETDASHSCGKGSAGCVAPKHLSWKTHSGNEKDKLRHGTHNRGERHNLVKLTEADVLKIRELRGVMYQEDIGLMYGISQTAVGNIQRGKRWGWLD